MAMNLGDVKIRVKRTFGDEAQVQITDVDIVRWVNDGQRHIVMSNEQVLQTSATADLVAGQQEYTLPTNLLVLQSISARLSSTTAFYALQRLDQQRFDQLLGPWESDSITKSVAGFYHVYAGVAKIYPIPVSSVTSGLKIYYSRMPTDVAIDTDVIDLPIPYHNSIVNYCLQQAYELDEDWSARDKKMEEVQLSTMTNKGRENWQGREYYPTITIRDEDL